VMSLDSATGQLSLRPALDAPELLAEPVRVALTALAPEHAMTVSETMDKQQRVNT